MIERKGHMKKEKLNRIVALILMLCMMVIPVSNATADEVDELNELNNDLKKSTLDVFEQYVKLSTGADPGFGTVKAVVKQCYNLVKGVYLITKGLSGTADTTFNAVYNRYVVVVKGIASTTDAAFQLGWNDIVQYGDVVSPNHPDRFKTAKSGYIQSLEEVKPRLTEVKNDIVWRLFASSEQKNAINEMLNCVNSMLDNNLVPDYYDLYLYGRAAALAAGMQPTAPVTSSVSWQNMSVTNITETDAKVTATISNPDCLTITSATFTLYDPSGSVFGTYTESPNLSDASIPYWLNLKARLNKALSPGTTYSYKISCVANGNTFTSAQSSFTTLSNANLSWANLNVSEITQTNAKVTATILNPGNINVSTVTLTLYNPDGSVFGSYPESCNRSTSTISYWLDLQLRLGKALNPGTTYTYKLECSGNGKTATATNSFTTIAPQDTTKPVISNVVISNISHTGYDISCTATDNVGVTQIRLGSWVTKDSVDSAKWITLSNNGSNTWKCRINVSEFNNQTGTYYNTNIYADDAAGNWTVSNNYNIFVPSYIPNISILYGHLSLQRGASQKIEVSIGSSDGQQPESSALVWTSSDPSVVAVDEEGVITARHLGVATVTATSPDGTVSDSVSVSVTGNLASDSRFFVDKVPVSILSVNSQDYGVTCLVREVGDTMKCAAQINFVNDSINYDIVYTVEEGSLMMNGDMLFVSKNTSRKNVIAAHVYDVNDDGSRGQEMECARITVFVMEEDGIIRLPSALQSLEAYALDGIKATTIVLPDSLKTLGINSLAGIPRGSTIYFNSDRINKFFAADVLGISDSRSEDYIWIDTGSVSYGYVEGQDCSANYYCLGSQVGEAWSGWLTKLPSDTTDYETKTQYRSRSISSQNVYSDWGNWVSNGTTPIDATDLRDVKTVAHAAQTKTVYTYNHYKYYNTSRSAWMYSYVDNSGNSYSTQGSWEYVESDTPYSQYSWAADSGYDGWRDGSNIPWYNQGTKQVTTANAYTEYLYRTRTVNSVTNYGAWSEWSDTAISETAALDVETRTVYRTKLYD